MTAAWCSGHDYDMLVAMRKLALLIFERVYFSHDLEPELKTLWKPMLRALAYISPGLWVMRGAGDPPREIQAWTNTCSPSSASIGLTPTRPTTCSPTWCRRWTTTNMTYFGFHFRFLLPWLVLLGWLLWHQRRQGRRLPPHLRNFPGWAVVLSHVCIAVVYTTPWDNYLVAMRVWWYDPALVAGLTLGWVPIEEYTFFVLQTLLTGLWLLWLAHRLPRAAVWQPSPRARWFMTLLAGLLWLSTPFLLFGRVTPATYLSLILIWALPPIALQLAFGADILWRYRRLVAAAILVPTLYLAAADTLAIGAGTWSISPEQTLGLPLPGGLPLEEALFFLVTNTLIGFGATLALAEESRSRLGWA